MKGAKDSYEAKAWEGIDGEWRPIHGSFDREGISVEWHDFQCAWSLNWGKSFHPDSLEICLNLEGTGTLTQGKSETHLDPARVAHYAAGTAKLAARRTPHERHRFVTVEMSRQWLAEAVRGHEGSLSRAARDFLEGRAKAGLAVDVQPLGPEARQISQDLIKPAVVGKVAKLWFRAKILELAALTLMEREEELFCQRQHRLATDRVQRVKDILARDLEYPPSLAELGREVGCSPFYLSRIFSEETGTTISRHLRNIRLEKAAELLKSGRCNVTEAAVTVGYSSLSHFSKAFAERYGECPCVFPLKTPRG